MYVSIEHDANSKQTDLIDAVSGNKKWLFATIVRLFRFISLS